MERERLNFLFLNVGHFFDHFMMLVFATAAALRLANEWNMGYSELILYATPGFIAFGVGALVAGWLADKWSRPGMIAIFFLGIGLSGIFTALTQTPLQIAIGLFFIGTFGAIYHPVGLAMVVQGRTKTGVPLAINGVFGNLGVASAALLTGFFIDASGWRMAFMVPGALCIALGMAYLLFLASDKSTTDTPAQAAAKAQAGTLELNRDILIRVIAIVLISTAIGGLIFQSTTFALPKVFDERLGDLATSASSIGWYAFVVFSVAAFAQLVVGYLVDNHSIRLVFSLVAALQAVLFLAMLNLTGAPALIVAIGFMLVVFGQIPINDVLVGRVSKSQWRSRMFAIRYIVTFSVSATAIPLIAWIHANGGFDRLFIVMAVAATLILVSVLALPKAGKLAVKPVPAA